MKKTTQYKLMGLSFVGVWGLLCFYVIPIVSVWAESQGSENKQLVSAEKSFNRKPDLHFEQKTYDFGTVYKGAVVERKFEFINKGGEVLKIDKVKPSCGCTAALITSKIIEPGESGEISTSFNSQKFRGRITKTIDIHSNDPDEHIIQLVIKGIVLDPFLKEPFLRK